MYGKTDTAILSIGGWDTVCPKEMLIEPPGYVQQDPYVLYFLAITFTDATIYCF